MLCSRCSMLSKLKNNSSNPSREKWIKIIYLYIYEMVFAGERAGEGQARNHWSKFYWVLLPNL